MQLRRHKLLPLLTRLVMFGCVLFIMTPANRVSMSPLPITAPAASPTPLPTPEGDEKPNPVRRFFSWVKNGITRPFRRSDAVIYDNYIVVTLSSSRSLVTFCPTNPLLCPSNREVTLVANGMLADGQGITYAWTVTGGRLRGDGREVIWNLSGLPEGTYTATVEAEDGNQHTAADSRKVTVSLCDGCDRPPPLCPSVSVSCPDGGEAKHQLTFVANVSGGEPDLERTYTWSVTAGKIISGQRTSKITVDVSDAGSQSVTATVSLGGFHPACTVGPASCTIPRHRSTVQPH